MTLPSLSELETIAGRVYRVLQPTPQINWPLLTERAGCEVWIKHENHNPTGAFKIRGGLIYVENLLNASPANSKFKKGGLCTATRGNHGQSIAYACSHFGIKSTIVVPEGNNPDKNRAMKALGAELVIEGSDFDESVEVAMRVADELDLYLMPSFHTDLVKGVASYSLELLKSVPDLDRIYLPIGLGSGICGMIYAREALGISTEIIGVVSSSANCYQQSFDAGHAITTNSADTLADGIAVRVPNEQALSIMSGNVARIVAVSDDDIIDAIGYYFDDTHNIVEGAAAAPLAALLAERELNRDKKVGLVVTGGNIDRRLFARVLAP